MFFFDSKLIEYTYIIVYHGDSCSALTFFCKDWTLNTVNSIQDPMSAAVITKSEEWCEPLQNLLKDAGAHIQTSGSILLNCKEKKNWWKGWRDSNMSSVK